MNKKVIYVFVTNKSQFGMIKNMLKKQNLNNVNVILVDNKILKYGNMMERIDIAFVSSQVKLYYQQYLNNVILPFLTKVRGRTKNGLYFFNNTEEILRLLDIK